ncbi:TonB-dependent receptor domain-containing protein [Ensifer adhaerens]|uniref:TonB-dependent receptor n=1 Tax=Ensifer adhaerens TaxID=106592 RepID=UPI003CFD198F
MAFEVFHNKRASGREGGRRAVLLAATAIALAIAGAPEAVAQSGSAASASVAQSDIRSFDIPAQALQGALALFNLQSGVQVSHAAGAIPADIRANAVSGRMTSSEALARLLSGTGVSHRFIATDAVVIGTAKSSAAPAADGATMLDPIVATGTLKGGKATYSTPSEYYVVDAEMLERVPVTSPGDILKGVPGVLASNNRSSTAIEPMIRGTQGAGRVALIVDGVENSSHTYKGYAGNAQNFYIDPDFISGYTVDKASSRTGSAAIGGTIEMRTVDADDLIFGDKNWGVRTQVGLGSNADDGSRYDVCTQVVLQPPHCLRPQVFKFDPALRKGIPDHDYSASTALGWRPNDILSFVLAYSHREAGNYSAGSNGSLMRKYTIPGWPELPVEPITSYDPGDEVFGTYKESDNYLFKARAELEDGHELSFVFSRMDIWNGSIRSAGTIAGGFNPYYHPATTKQNNIGFEHRWNPEEGGLIDLRTKVWTGKVEEHRFATGLSRETKNHGFTISNTSQFTLADLDAQLDVGVHGAREDLKGERGPFLGGFSGDWQFAEGRMDRLAAFSTLGVDLTSWLRVEGGLRNDRSHFSRELPKPLPMNDSGVAEASYSATTGHLRAAFDLPWEGAAGYMGYSQGWRSPSMREIGLLNSNPDGSAIRPERKRALEFGASYASNDVFRDGDFLGAKLGYFDNRYTDYITGNGFMPGYANMPSLTHRGLELSLRYDATRFYAEYGLTHYLEAKICGMPQLPSLNDSVGCNGGYGALGDLIGVHAVPKNLHNLTLGARFLDEALDVGMRVTHATETAFELESIGGANVDNFAPPFTTVDLYAKHKINDWVQLAMSVENLTDRFYLDAATGAANAVPAPGRTFRVNLTTRF